MFDDLSRDDKLLLLKLLCSFAWADLEVSDSERRFVHRVVRETDLGENDGRQVGEWLDVAPSPGSIDLAKVPAEHRRLFFEAVRALIHVDGKVDPDEAASLEKLRHGLGLG